ncbi:MAG: RNA-directed DNA polymerase [Gammaproteobacteria bacterium]|nr:RNA-directed DNA polymerase [Gammaproteobacteria bacterium]
MEVTFEQLHDAALQCRRGKLKGTQAQRFECDRLGRLYDLQQALQTYTWQPSAMRQFIAQNGSKPREIHAPAYADRVVHHWLIAQLRPLIEPKFIFDCAANIKGRGTHFAVQRLGRMMRQQPSSYYLQLDIFNFFYQIDQHILLAQLHTHLSIATWRGQLDAEQQRGLYWLCQQLISTPIALVHTDRPRDEHRLPQHKRLLSAPLGKGLPIGNLSSQFFSNVYLNALDQFVKHTLKVQHYSRYVDDFVLLHPCRQQLLAWRAEIATFLNAKLALSLKDSGKLAPVSHGVDFLGYISYAHHRRVRARVLHQFRVKLQSWWSESTVSRGHGVMLAAPDFAALQSMVASYWGHCQHAKVQSKWREIWLGFSWLRYFFHWQYGMAPRARWRIPKPLPSGVQVTTAKGQFKWFDAALPGVLLMQLGNRVLLKADEVPVGYVPLAIPWQRSSALVTLPLGVLEDICQSLSASSAWAYVEQCGYRSNHLRQRQLARCFFISKDRL